MELHLSADQQAFIQEAIENGRLRNPEDAFEQAMSLWEERERRRMEILSAANAAEASLARGEGRRMHAREEVISLAEDVKRRAAARFHAENKPR